MSARQSALLLSHDHPTGPAVERFSSHLTGACFADILSLRYHCRRSQQEEIAAMNARTDQACAAHRALARLHSERAVAILVRKGPAPY